MNRLRAKRTNGFVAIRIISSATMGNVYQSAGDATTTLTVVTKATKPIVPCEIVPSPSFGKAPNISIIDFITIRLHGTSVISTKYQIFLLPLIDVQMADAYQDVTNVMVG